MPLAALLTLVVCSFVCRTPDTATARQLFRSSLLYLPLLMAGLAVHRMPNQHLTMADVGVLLRGEVQPGALLPAAAVQEPHLLPGTQVMTTADVAAQLGSTEVQQQVGGLVPAAAAAALHPQHSMAAEPHDLPYAAALLAGVALRDSPDGLNAADAPALTVVLQVAGSGWQRIQAFWSDLLGFGSSIKCPSRAYGDGIPVEQQAEASAAAQCSAVGQAAGQQQPRISKQQQ